MRVKQTLMGLALLASSAVAMGAAPNDLGIFFPDVALDGRDREAVSVAAEWMQGERYPFLDGQKTMYLYGGGQATLVCAPLRLCLIELQAGEKVQPNGIQLGDSARWQATPVVGSDMTTSVVMKPVQVGLDTNIALITDQRTYHVRLISRAADYMPVIGWTYPDEQKAAWDAYYKQVATTTEKNTLPTGENIAGMDFRYRIEGCETCGWRPLRVYNNGVQTVIDLPSLQGKEAPALLVLDSSGQEALVNYRVAGSRYLVDQVFSEAVLVIGIGDKQERVTIRRGG
ncbi:MAG: P-type conjugative transfer protein TrbG [Thiothrix lacustris]|uniref:P-type conjugative transfer protein TrbG n=1 Tax=Thiothrix lacustris TaxID=525917 RepID=A0A1Y1QUY0_9GAMM|nr:MAG: P-type conjugative transfer protein TrbG [Thiothrix lacustris]